jgi:hypothetical protein
MELDQTASSEANAARAAGMETANPEENTSDVDELVDYNEDSEEDLDAALRETQAQIKELERRALKEMLISNGHALREILKSEKVKDHFVSPFSEENAMSIEDILGEIPKEDLHDVGTLSRRIFMPASFVQKWIIPTIRARNALKEHCPETPGGIETALLFSIFDQSILDTTKARPQRDEEANQLRALVSCAQDANYKLIERMRKGGDGIKNIARASLNQLEQGVQMPSLDDMFNMSQCDYDFYKERAAQAIQQYRGHTERDLNDLQLLREQTALQASLIWEQQMQICDMNKAYLELSDERERIIFAENKVVQDGMGLISTTMTEMQQLLQNRHEVIVANMDRIDSPMIEASIRKLKTALHELQFSNAQLVMRNETLNRQLTFMPPEMWDVIAEAANKKTVRYEQQWVDPHYLHLSAGEYVFMKHEPDSGIAVDRMRRCASLTSVKDLLLEADEVLQYLKCHNGIVDQPINENNNIVEDATDMHGVIPSANEIDTPTVAATLATRLRMIQTIQQNDGAPKRTHNTVPLGHNVQPTKVPKPNPQASLQPNCFSSLPQRAAHGMRCSSTFGSTK